ncbi:MAG TPA: hypothetical protein VN724_01250, partial [Pyrinomonadaceae bacterium]|nr:hypothetical protein [Pyrinomonadaceae bacterium]
MTNETQRDYQHLTIRRISAVATVLLFLVAACNAQTKYPDTPAGNQAKGLLDAFNTGDGAKYKEFL